MGFNIRFVTFLVRLSFFHGSASLIQITNSLAASFLLDMLAYATTIIWSSPDSFYIPATISFTMVALAAIVFTLYVKQQRGHVIHAKRLFKVL